MKAKSRIFMQVNVTFEKRDDGGLRVYSDDVPGFVLSHSDCSAVFADIAPALETILSERFKAVIKVGPLQELREQLEDGGIIPIYEQHEQRTYVALFAA